MRLLDIVDNFALFHVRQKLCKQLIDYQVENDLTVATIDPQTPLSSTRVGVWVSG